MSSTSCPHRRRTPATLAVYTFEPEPSSSQPCHSSTRMEAECKPPGWGPETTSPGFVELPDASDEVGCGSRVRGNPARRRAPPRQDAEIGDWRAAMALPP